MNQILAVQLPSRKTIITKTFRLKSINKKTSPLRMKFADRGVSEIVIALQIDVCTATSSGKGLSSKYLC